MAERRAAVARLVAEVSGCDDPAASDAFAAYLCALRRLRGPAATPQIDAAVWRRLGLTAERFAELLLRFNDALAAAERGQPARPSPRAARPGFAAGR